ncbi:MAG: hypothetical protein ACREQB_10155 [Candidatus Binataceae bacterium]
MAECAPCERTVLTYVALTDDGGQSRCCVHCDAPVGAQLKWVGAEELQEDGYVIGAPAARKSGGGCSSGGCGTCGTGKH